MPRAVGRLAFALAPRALEMPALQFLDNYSIALVVLGFAVATLVCYEIGFRFGRWWQRRMPGEQEGPAGVLVGALLGLTAFLLAVTMGMAADRFDTRRGLVVAEANAISKTYLEADYLPAAQADQLKELLREYLPLRVATSDLAQVQANIQRSAELQQQMWAIVGASARSGYLSDLMSSLGDSLTEIVNLSESRVVAGIYSRVPETILLLLLVGSALGLGMVGYSAGLTERRSVVTAAVLVIALGAVMTIVLDLDRPQEGFLRVSHQALLDVQKLIGQPTGH
jgi:hypothetical protein